MDATDKMARIYSTSPLDILSREAEDVIRLLNYLVERGEDKQEHRSEEKRTDDIMKKVTSKTATGGWW